MKQCWHPEELARYWTRSRDEHALLANNTAATRFAFVVLLKALQCDSRFPERHEDVPRCGLHAFGVEDEPTLVDWLSARVMTLNPYAKAFKGAAYTHRCLLNAAAACYVPLYGNARSSSAWTPSSSLPLRLGRRSTRCFTRTPL